MRGNRPATRDKALQPTPRNTGGSDPLTLARAVGRRERHSESSRRAIARIYLLTASPSSRVSVRFVSVA